MHKWRFILVSLFLIILSTYCSYLIYPESNNFGALKFSVDRQEIISKANEIASKHEINLRNYRLDIKLYNDNKLIREIQEKYGLVKGNQFLRDVVPGYWWDLDWKDIDDLVTMSENDDFGNSGSGWTDKSDLHYKFDLHGNLIYFSRNIPDSLKSKKINIIQAKDIVYEFAHHFAPQIDLRQATLIDNKVSVEPSLESGGIKGREQLSSRSILPKSFDFKWLERQEEVQEDIEIRATVTGRQLTKLEFIYVLEEKDAFDDLLAGILLILSVIAIATTIIILGYKKSRAFEIRFRLAIILGIIVLILYAIEMLFLVSRLEDWEALFSIVLAPVFLAGTFVIVWAVSESVGREIWRDKFIPLDLLVNGHVFHSKLGEGILRGLVLGSLAFSILLGLTWILSHISPLTAVTTSEYVRDMYAFKNPALFLLGHSFWSDMYILPINFLLIMSLIYKKTGKGQLTIVLSSIPLAIIMPGQMQPFYMDILIKALALMVLLWGFFRYDLLTAFISLVMYQVLDVALSFTMANGSFLQSSWMFLVAFFGLISVYAVSTIFTKDSVSDYSEIEPALSKFINERQRMQQELKIARDVQMSFLPAHIPITPGLDIASLCIPALNVGGDYFDFVKIAPKKIGVVIGDVSGKGTRAAFYMTLVKGFLKALSRRVTSPAELLKELNILFFENAKRDAFISMAYGVFDAENKTLNLARSGHNPVIIYQKSADEIKVVKTEGLALGLEKGTLFNKMMQETRIEINTGDIILFYTDGLSEARNKLGEEFGEEKLYQSIIHNANNSAEKILHELFSEVKRFSRGQAQHDDMSAVVVKVT